MLTKYYICTTNCGLQVGPQDAMNWDKLLRDFRENRCILLLGPRLATVANKDQRLPLREKLAAQLAASLHAAGIALTEKECLDLPYVAQRYMHGDTNLLVELWDKMDDFYRTESKMASVVFEKIAALPASIFISTTPDDFIYKALQQQEKEPWPLQHYNFRRPHPLEVDMNQVSAQKPLVYNLVGSLDDKESLVLTPADQVEFIRKVLEKNPPVPTDLLAQFSPFRTYLFFGFDLENWYLRLLLDGLGLSGNAAFSPQMPDYPLSNPTRAFYEEKFNFHFIDEGIETFADEILHRLKPDGVARTKNVVALATESDHDFVAELERAMLPGEKNGEISLFHEGRILPGENVAETLKAKIETADAVIALVSPDFFADENLLDNALEWAKNRPEALLPLIIRPCDWRADRDLRKTTPLPDDGLPVSLSANRDEAFRRIVEQLKRRFV